MNDLKKHIEKDAIKKGLTGEAKELYINESVGRVEKATNNLKTKVYTAPTLKNAKHIKK